MTLRIQRDDHSYCAIASFIEDLRFMQYFVKSRPVPGIFSSTIVHCRENGDVRLRYGCGRRPGSLSPGSARLRLSLTSLFCRRAGIPECICQCFSHRAVNILPMVTRNIE